MKVDEFDFDLPPERIADRPVEPRDAARLLAVRRDGLEDCLVADLPQLLAPGDVMVVNDTRVLPARLHGHRGEVRIEATLLSPSGPDAWRAMARPGRRLRVGDRIVFAEGFAAEVAAKHEGGEVSLRFPDGEQAVRRMLERHGEPPLPPYIASRRPADQRDRNDYQTVYAAREGAVAAPTAGLHFTPALLAALSRRGVRRADVTLHVGLGTFQPVKVAEVEEHRMHPEWGEVTVAAAEAINRARADGGRVVAVGTTALRLLETAAAEDGSIRPFAGETSIFITPGYRFRTADLLLTNFHLPRSTLMMLVCAFAGLERMRSAYAHAIAAGYRFYSYGDASLLHRADP